LADRKLKYSYGQSRIVYIGTTKNGMNRIAQSAATHAESVLSLHGIKSFTVRLVTCTPIQKVKTWHKLERASLILFREIYGEIPECNTVGKSFKEIDEFSIFARERLRRVIKQFGED